MAPTTSCNCGQDVRLDCEACPYCDTPLPVHWIYLDGRTKRIVVFTQAGKTHVYCDGHVRAYTDVLGRGLMPGRRIALPGIFFWRWLVSVWKRPGAWMSNRKRTLSTEFAQLWTDKVKGV